MNRNQKMEHPKGSVGTIKISGVGTYLPSDRLTNEIIATRAPIDPDWVRLNLGILERRIARVDETTSDLAANAGRAALEDADVHPRNVQMVIVATTTPDRQAPATACYVQGKLGIRGAPAFDLAAVCSGFIYGLTTAAQFIENGFCDNALVIGADTFSRITNWQSRDCVYFGDGAGAVYLEHSRNPKAFFLSQLTADGVGQEHFTVPPGDPWFSIDPKGVYRSAKQLVSQMIRDVLRHADLEPCDIDHVIPHQASVKLLRDIASETGLSLNKFWLHMDRYANTAAATIPIALDEAVRSSEVRDGDWMLFAAAGAGMTSGAAVYRWH